jgi:hypothetical protein
MTDILNYPDNLVLHLARDKCSYKCFTTDRPDYFKIINGLSFNDAVIDTKYINERELKQLLVDSCVNGYELKLNLAFKKGLYGIACELAKEREEQMIKDMAQSIENEVAELAEELGETEVSDLK